MEVISDLLEDQSQTISLAPGAVVLRRFALLEARSLLTEVQKISARAPFRHLITPWRTPDVGCDDELRRGWLGF